MIDPATAAAVVTAANRCREMLTDRLNADPDSPMAEALRILAARAGDLATEYAAHERRTT